jgi:acyl-coenzyme A synthetase/AMP-(fatty) acid ligase
MIGPGDTEDPVHIGWPIDNVRVHVLDETGTEMQVGAKGELYIAGSGLATGYRNEPALTQQRFIEHPTLGRLYRTGDICRTRPDGRVEFLGREDTQIKLRGHRIELGEIEAVAERHPAIDRAVATVREDSTGDARLTLYLQPRGNESLPISTLRDHLRQYLPDYMVPQWITWLESMPLTSSGKVDRNNLPLPTQQGRASRNSIIGGIQ